VSVLREAEPPSRVDFDDGVLSARAMRRVGDVLLGGPALALLAALAWLVARWRSWHLPRGWWAILVAVSCGALALRLTVTPALSNWYAEVATPGDQLWARFGPVSFSFQNACAAVLPWSDSTLFAVDAVLGALCIPLFALTLRACGADFRAALGTTVLLAMAPLHIRVSASPSEHVLASTLTMLALVLWTFAARDHRWWLGAAALMVLPAIAFTRADAVPQLLLVPLWGLAARWEACAGDKRLRWVDWIAVAVYGAVVAAIGIATWRLVVIPSHHPGPEAHEVMRAALDLLSQFWTTAAAPPHWIPFSAVVLGAVGLAVLLPRRRVLLTVVVASLAVCFVPIGRTLGSDGLLGSRYFLVAIAIALVLSGAGFGWVCSLVDRAVRAAANRWERGLPSCIEHWATGGMTVVLVATAWFEGRAPMAYRYAFQDEYQFLRGAMKSLPSNCTLAQLPMRTQVLQRDLDCCLDAPRSPLLLARPDLRFLHVEPQKGAPSFGGATCVAYYEGAACSLADTPASRARDPNARAWFTEGCSLMRSSQKLEVLAEAEVSPHATFDHFKGRPVVVRLYRVQRNAPAALP
jgi:hypothetical protein